MGEIAIPILQAVATTVASQGMSMALGDDEAARTLNDPEEANKQRNQRLQDWVAQMQQQQEPTAQATQTVQQPSIEQLMRMTGGG